MTEDRRTGWAVRLMPPEEGPKPLWVCKIGGGGPGWTLSPDPKGRVVHARKEDAVCQLDNLPMVAQIRIEKYDWQPEIFRVRSRRKAKTSKEAPREVQAPAPAPTECDSVQDLVVLINQVRLHAEKLACELEMGSTEEHYAMSVHASLSRKVRQGMQLFREADVSA